MGSIDRRRRRNFLEQRSEVEHLPPLAHFFSDNVVAVVAFGAQNNVLSGRILSRRNAGVRMLQKSGQFLKVGIRQGCISPLRLSRCIAMVLEYVPHREVVEIAPVAAQVEPGVGFELHGLFRRHGAVLREPPANVRGAGVPPKRFAALLPLREGVAELRLKGASFATTRELLAMAGIEVATDTVRRFYRRSGRRVTPSREAFTKNPKTSRVSASESADPSNSAVDTGRRARCSRTRRTAAHPRPRHRRSAQLRTN